MSTYCVHVLCRTLGHRRDPQDDRNDSHCLQVFTTDPI